MSNIIIGCVADDFSGASDAASFFVKAGVRTYLFNGIPKEPIDFSSDDIAIIIALKTRTEEKSRAVKDSIDAFDWLKAKGAKIIFKVLFYI